MKVIDKFLEKVGTDKVLHFLVGALFTAYASMLGVEFMWGCIVFLVPLAFVKELLDSKPDIMDILAAMVGYAFSVAVYWVCQLLLLI